MNKLIVMIALCAMVPAEAMNIMTISEKEKRYFAQQLSEMVTFGNNMVAEQKISINNSIHVIHRTLSEELNDCKGDLLTIVTKRDLNDLIEDCTDAIERMEYVQDLRRELFKNFCKVKTPEIECIEKQVTAFRQKCSGIWLKKLQTHYFDVPMINDKDEDRVNFMLKNEQYPMDEHSQNAFIGILIYQLTIALRIPYDLSVVFGDGPCEIKEMKTT